MRLQLVTTEEDRMAVGASEAEAFANVLARAFDLYVRKNAQYGSAWREQGYMGSLARILSKAARLKNMQWTDTPHEHSDESVEDNVTDLLNLCVFFLLNRQQHNRWGVRHGE